jgi:DNA (cytosine-5)-methyltransferase 1
VHGPAIAVEDCGFRMLESHEIAAGMGFEDSHVIPGNKRERVQQCGQAVTPSWARWLWERVLETLR